MGLDPAAVDRLSFWQYRALLDATNAAYGDTKPEAPSEAEFEAALLRHHGH